MTKDQANYYSGITSSTVNGKNAYELKGKFLNDLHKNAFSSTNREDAVEHIEYFLKIVDPIDLSNKLGSDEIKPTKDETSDLEETDHDDEQEIDPDLLTKDIEGFKTYEEFKDDWIYKWKNDMPWVKEKPWTNYGAWNEPTSDLAAKKSMNLVKYQSFGILCVIVVMLAVLDNMLNSRTHKACAKLERKCNEALQDLDKNPLVLDTHSKIETFQGQVDRLHVKGLESEREKLKSSETQLLQEIDGLRQDRVVVVSKVLPHVATELVRCNEIAFDDDLATTYYPFTSKATVDQYASLEKLLSKKPKSLRTRPAPSNSKPSSSRAPVSCKVTM
ncbi:hypothetical protein Tco_1345072 [Tanacetum coccineum]